MASKESIWGSSRLPSAQLIRTRLPSATHTRPATNEQGKWARPPSGAIHPPIAALARPDSRQLSRPRNVSYLDSRPSSRLDSRPVSRQDLERPKSGSVRPLSGKVFMRRTVDHGWVAKAYTNGPTSVRSQTDLDLFDDLSDCDSLDSFFDDDFDSQTSEQKLGNLLSCNTLGVDSKAKRLDWVPGKFGLPEFHCPRCRDHWYGLTDVPCDEELARLIREGLWYTGKGDGGKFDKGIRSGRVRKGNEDKDYKSHSNITLSSRTSSSTRVDKDVENDIKGHKSTLAGATEHAKKTKKRITFKLDNDNENSESSDVSNTQLDGYGGRGRGNKSGNVTQGKETAMDSNQSGSLTSLGKSKMGSSKEGADGGMSRTKTQEESRGRAGMKKERRRHNNGSDSFSEDSEGSGLLDGETKKNKKKLNEKLITIATHLASSDSGGLTETDSSGGVGGRNIFSGQINRQVTTGETDRRESIGEGRGHDDGSNANSIAQFSLSTSIGQGSGREENKGNKDSSSQVRQAGSRRGSLGLDDHGKNVHKAGGYMRAVSPNSSDWGDPTHGRLFISSTATSRTVSRCGSAVNLHSKQNGDTENDDTLPPIVPAIVNKKPLIDMLDILPGFQFTRAWTFSYHN